MSDHDHCSKCGGYLREDGGCTNCERKAFLSGPVKEVSVREAGIILDKPVEVKDRKGNAVVFSKEKLFGKGAHLQDDHPNADFRRRAKRLLFAIDTVKTGKCQTGPHEGRDGIVRQRSRYRKQYAKTSKHPAFRALVVADAKGYVREVFTYAVNE